jgi:hypothetical protein
VQVLFSGRSTYEDHIHMYGVHIVLFNVICTGGLPKTSGLRVASPLEAQDIRICI